MELGWLLRVNKHCLGLLSPLLWLQKSDVKRRQPLEWFSLDRPWNQGEVPTLDPGSSGTRA